MIKRTVVCGICGIAYTEQSNGEGFPNWGQLQGIVLDGDENPYLCPQHLAFTAEGLDRLKHSAILIPPEAMLKVLGKK